MLTKEQQECKLCVINSKLRISNWKICIMHKILDKLFGLYKENGQLILKIFGIKIKFRWANINQLEDVCCIQNLNKLRQQNTYFPHPIGIVIHPDVKIGSNCTIFQNVTIGSGNYSEKNKTNIPTIGNNVVIYANASVIGGIKIGNNSIIGAGAIVINDVEDNVTVVGNPARPVYKNKHKN